MKVYRTVDQYMRKFFPKTYLKEKLAKMSSSERAKYNANLALNRLRKALGLPLQTK